MDTPLIYLERARLQRFRNRPSGCQSHTHTFQRFDVVLSAHRSTTLGQTTVDVVNTMLSHNDDDRRPCYFTIIPPSYDHFSVETPCCSPNFCQDDCTPAYSQHPLLASRELLAAPLEIDLFKPTTSVMSMQTSAAHGSPRPKPYPMQNVLHVTSDDSTSSSGSSNCSFGSPLETARCSRCQRTPSIDIRTGKNNMVQYGLNLWYCSRCATLVGLTKR